MGFDRIKVKRKEHINQRHEKVKRFLHPLPRFLQIYFQNHTLILRAAKQLPV